MQDLLNICSSNTRDLFLKRFQIMKKILIVILLFAGISGSLLFYVKNQDSENQAEDGVLSQSSSTTSIPQPQGDSSEAVANTSAPNQPNNYADEISIESDVDDQLEIVRRVWDAADANAYFDALSSLEQIDPELAAEKRRDLDDFCSDMMLAANPESIRKKRQTFCNGYLASPRRRAKDIEEYMDEMSVSAASRLEENIKHSLKKAQTDDETTEVFTRLVVQARFPEQIHTLIGQNTQGVMRHQIRLWRLGEEIQKERYPSADLLKAQTVALLLYQCAKFGGCGSSQYFTVNYCTNYLSGRCASTATVEEMLYQTTPPADFNLANEILSKLLTLHRNRNGS